MTERAPTWWSPTGDGGISVVVRVSAGGRRSEVIAVTPERLRVRVAAPPVEGRANDELRRFVAVLFGVRASAVTLVRGHRARDKTLRVDGVTAPPDDLRFAG